MANKEKKKSIYDSIKEKLENTGNGGKIFFTTAGDKKKIRMLTDFEEALPIEYHNSPFGSEARFSHPCLKYYGKKCPHCGDKNSKNDTLYAYSAYDYKSQEVKLFLYKANKCSPLAALMSIYDVCGTIVDKDFTISQIGEQSSKTFNLVAGDKKQFKVDVEKLTEEEIFEIIKGDKYAYNLGDGVEEEDSDDDEDEEEVKPKKKAKKEEVPVKNKKAPVVEDDDDDDDFDDDEEDEDEDEEEEEVVVVKKKKKK
jgi:hypothetical protein